VQMHHEYNVATYYQSYSQTLDLFRLIVTYFLRLSFCFKTVFKTEILGLKIETEFL
jgi:hypothetical protein